MPPSLPSLSDLWPLVESSFLSSAYAGAPDDEALRDAEEALFLGLLSAARERAGDRGPGVAECDAARALLESRLRRPMGSPLAQSAGTEFIDRLEAGIPSGLDRLAMPLLARRLAREADHAVARAAGAALGLLAYSCPLDGTVVEAVRAVLSREGVNGSLWPVTADLLGRIRLSDGEALARDTARAVLVPHLAGTAPWRRRLWAARANATEAGPPVSHVGLTGDMGYLALRSTLQTLTCYDIAGELVPAWLALLDHPESSIRTLAADRIILGGGLLHIPELATDDVVAGLAAAMGRWTEGDLADTNLVRYRPGDRSPELCAAMARVVIRDPQSAVALAADAPAHVLRPVLGILLDPTRRDRPGVLEQTMETLLRRRPMPLDPSDLVLFFKHPDERVRAAGIMLSATDSLPPARHV